MFEVTIPPRPGVVFYFDAIGPALARFTNAQLGALVRGIIEYAQTGALPELDGMEGLAFDMMRPKIDKDGEAYIKNCVHTSYMNQCKRWKEQGVKPISESSFTEQAVVTYKNLAETCRNLPGATQDANTDADANANTEPNTSTISAITTTADTAATGKGEQGGSKGDERENPSADSRSKAWNDFQQRRAAAAKGATR